MSSALLADVIDSALAGSAAIHSLLIIRHGYVILDAAFYPFAAGERHDLASITKSITSLLTGVAARAQLLDREHSVLLALSRDTARYGAPKRRITIGNLLDMQSGFDCGYGEGEVELAAMQRAPEWIDFALALPMRTTPGREIRYCSPNYHMVSSAITKSVGVSESAFARRELFEILGIHDVYWPSDPSGNSHGWGDLQLQSRDLAKIGFLYLHGGRWAERQILDSGWVLRSATPRVPYGARSFYGNGWWTHLDSPPGFYEAVGRGGQRLSLWPATDLIIVTFGGGFDPGRFAGALLRALVSDSALPPDSVGAARLQSRVAAALAGPPSSTGPEIPPLIAGRRFVFSKNAVGLRAMTLTGFDSVPTAHLEVDDRRLALPLGMDGRLRISPDTIQRVHPGARAWWHPPGEFVLELDLLGKIDRYTIRLRLEGTRVHGRIDEATTGLSIPLTGRALP